MPVSSPVQFGASLVGDATLKSKESPRKEKVRLYQLTGTPDDLLFLKNGLETIRKQKPGASMVPFLPGIEAENHFELAEEAFERSLTLLRALKQGEILQSPLVFVALDQANQLLGISLGHIERHLPDGSRIYTPFRDNLEADRSDGRQSPNHSSINWLVRLAPAGLGGVGKVLTALQERLLPDSVKRIDVVSETPEYTASAEPLYSQFGFRTKEVLRDAFIRPDFHGIPMSATRNDYQKRAREVLEAFEFHPESSKVEEDLSEKVRFPFYRADENA